MKRIVFLGAGNMAEALVSGLVNSNLVSPSFITVTDVRPERLQYMADKYAVAVTPDNKAAVARADIIFLAVKPQQIEKVLQDIADTVRPAQIVVSIAAGITTGFIEKLITKGTPVIRTMPNTPALLSAGAVALCGGSSAGQYHRDIVKSLFLPVGMVVELTEDKLNAVTALSGSGPAYVFYLAEAMEQAGKEMGIPDDLSSRLARQTVFGAGKMLAELPATAAELRKQVTSPGGTTEAAIGYMQEKDFLRTVKDAVIQAQKRAQELSK